MRIIKKISTFLIVGLFFLLPEASHSQQPKEFEIVSAGIRGGYNLGGLKPAEKHTFQQYDAFAILAFPGSWEWPRGWEARYRWFASAGVLNAAGENGFIGSTGPGLMFTKWDWNITVDVGTGAVFVSKVHFGRQDFGGPVQILGQGGIRYHFPGNMMLGWRFQHFSDAGLYGTHNLGVDLHMLELSYRF